MKRAFTLVGFILLLPFLGALSCDPFCNPKETYFDINGLKLFPLVVSGTAFSDGKFYREDQEGDTVAFSNYFLRAVFEVSYYAQRESHGSRGAGLPLP